LLAKLENISRYYQIFPFNNKNTPSIEGAQKKISNCGRKRRYITGYIKSFAYRPVLFTGLKRVDAGCTDVFIFIRHNALAAVAEDTGGLIFSQNDPLVAHKNLQGVPLSNVHGSAKLNGQHNPT
jgi:hypothetical protein